MTSLKWPQLADVTLPTARQAFWAISRQVITIWESSSVPETVDWLGPLDVLFPSLSRR